ncbi:Fungal Zn binuclear cluster domain-containing protein [Colletotrichum asianum]
MTTPLPESRVAKYHQIRHHKKSRRGCLECKTRRCDEKKPTCSACARRETQCHYVEPALRRPPGQEKFGTGSPQTDTDDASANHRQPSPSYESIYTPEHLLHLRLLHHYNTCTVQSFTDAFQLEGFKSEVLRLEVPSLALQHHYLMDALLSVTLLHLASTNPSTDLPVTKYRDRAVRQLRQQVEQVSEDNARPVFMASLLLSVTALAADRHTGYDGIWLTNWLAMAVGPRMMIDGLRKQVFLRPTPQRSIPLEHAAPVAIPLDLEDTLRMDEDDEDWEFRQDLQRAATGIGKLFGSLACPTCDGCVAFKARAWPFSFVSSRFVDMARQRRPRALAVMSYYLPFFHWFPRVWLYEDVAVQEMERIALAVGTEWATPLAAPKVAVRVKDTSLLKEYLLGLVSRECLRDESSFEGFV